MTQKTKSAIRLEEAYFCLSCEVVTNSAGACLVCGDTQLWPLQNWIGRVDDRNSRYGAAGFPNDGEENHVSGPPSIRWAHSLNGASGSPGERCAGRWHSVMTRKEK